MTTKSIFTAFGLNEQEELFFTYYHDDNIFEITIIDKELNKTTIEYDGNHIIALINFLDLTLNISKR